MNRRNFLSLFGVGVAGIALDQAIPLGRVWSFPKKIVVACDKRMLPPRTVLLDEMYGINFQWDDYEDLVLAEFQMANPLIDDASGGIIRITPAPRPQLPP